MKHCTETGKFYLKRNYARCLKQLEIEAKALTTHKPQSRTYRNAKRAIESIGFALKSIEQRWIKCEINEPIIQELSDLA
jgi:DNA polymerase/3'-5' exonuclease PolX